MNPVPSHRFSRNDLAVIAFTSTYMAAALAFSFVVKNSEFIYYFVVMLLLIGAIVTLHRTIRLHAGALWGLSIWGLLHMAGGLMPIRRSWPVSGDSYVLYNWWLIPGFLKYDQVVHAYGFGLVTWICWECLRKAFETRGASIAPSGGLLILCVAGGMGFGALNEVVEFIATLTLPSTNVGGYENTGWDLVSNLVGCVATAGMISVCDTRGQKIQSEEMGLRSIAERFPR